MTTPHVIRHHQPHQPSHASPRSPPHIHLHSPPTTKPPMPRPKSTPERTCLVTVGATVGFKALTDTVLDPAFWTFLSSKSFTALRVQCGPDVDWASARVSARQDEFPKGFSVEVFETRKNLMMEEMALCKAGGEGARVAGIIIAHAGRFFVSFASTPGSHF